MSVNSLGFFALLKYVSFPSNLSAVPVRRSSPLLVAQSARRAAARGFCFPRKM
jgi:hypothetical protein